MIQYPVSYPSYPHQYRSVSYSQEVLFFTILTIISLICYMDLCIAAETILHLLGVFFSSDTFIIIHPC